MPKLDLLALIADDTAQISYRPRWNALTGGICGTILLQQVIYRWVKCGRRPFYKFSSPCDHKACRDGDSWYEELGMSRREFEGARNNISTHTKGELAADTFVSYWTDADRKTWYALNEELLVEKLAELYDMADPAPTGIQKAMSLQPPPPPLDDELLYETSNSPDAIVQNEQYLLHKTSNSYCTDRAIAIVQNEQYLLTKNTTKNTTKKNRERGTPAPASEFDEWMTQNGIPKPITDSERQLLNHPAVRSWLYATQRWPGYDLLMFIAAKLGSSPDEAVLTAVWQEWIASGYKRANIAGVLEWYTQRVANPTWHPRQQLSTNKQSPTRPVAKTTAVLGQAPEDI